MRTLASLEQLQSAIAAGDRQAILRARGILAKIALRGSPALMAELFRGVILAWDESDAVWRDEFAC